MCTYKLYVEETNKTEKQDEKGRARRNGWSEWDSKRERRANSNICYTKRITMYRTTNISKIIHSHMIFICFECGVGALLLTAYHTLVRTYMWAHETKLKRFSANILHFSSFIVLNESKKKTREKKKPKKKRTATTTTITLRSATDQLSVS